MYAHKFDTDGNVICASDNPNEKIIYQSNYKNEDNLPYFSHASINNGYVKAKKQDDLRNLVLDQEKLLQDSMAFTEKPHVKVNPVTYRYYTAMPYQNTIKSTEDNQIYSEFWTVCAYEVNLLEQPSTTLLFVWLTCLIPFFLAAWILSKQTYKTVIFNSKSNAEVIFVYLGHFSS